MKYEYVVLGSGIRMNIELEINAAAKEGYRLIEFLATPSNSYTAVMEREVR